MRRIGLISTMLVIAAASWSQVTIETPRVNYEKSSLVPVKITNTSRSPVQLCVEFGQIATLRNGDRETRPIPFYAQRLSDRGWSTLMNGPDVGSIRAVGLLLPGESKEFPYRFNEDGRHRLILDFWKESKEIDCKKPPASKHTTKSNPFTVKMPVD